MDRQGRHLNKDIEPLRGDDRPVVNPERTLARCVGELRKLRRVIEQAAYSSNKLALILAGLRKELGKVVVT